MNLVQQNLFKGQLQRNGEVKFIHRGQMHSDKVRAALQDRIHVDFIEATLESYILLFFVTKKEPSDKLKSLFEQEWHKTIKP